MKRISLSLPIANNYGWGICGLELTKALDRVTGNQDAVQLFDPNPNSLLKEFVPITWNPKFPETVEETMLHAIQGATMFPLNLLTWSRTRNIGLCFIEDPDLAERYLSVANSYFDHIITGSAWCTKQLRKRGFPSVSTAIQGVDSNVFCPGPEKPPSDKFVIGSFGKFEYRKGQDIVIAAFKQLMDKYPDMHLLCGWGNLWPETMDTMAASKLIEYCKVGGDWKTRCKAIFMLNKIPASRYTLPDMVPHEEMAPIYRGVHYGVFPSRCEAGTNLPVMELASCGVPASVSWATGHLDVVGEIKNASASMELRSINSGRAHFSGPIDRHNDCSEVDPRDVASFIEVSYTHRELVANAGLEKSQFMKRFTWDKMAESVLEYV